ncbi:uncharacterized protein BXZ73DRAFT_97775 [Epithele typhae]|uniref:uncharacterized protein n=1 Tax=Epithele typhae TaxID=378194 RepID=UPI0020082A20|nr:uncharacterized protein BXZ73DRAFT_97775 [Epithele typhae]KAH9942360.1 hypothetical protein BXZ73DRAFT_97775 [Epithele typhae]
MQSNVPPPSTGTSQTAAPPGTAGYLQGLLSRARAAHPDIPMDPVVLQSLLLCLIAQPRTPVGTNRPDKNTHVGVHLILRTKEEDVSLLVNIVALILQQVLGIPAHKQKISSKSSSPPSTVRARRPRTRQQSSSSSIHAPFERPEAFLRALFFRRAPPCSVPSHRSPTPRSRADTTPRAAPVPLAAQPPPRATAHHAPRRSASFPAPSTDGEEDGYFDAASLASSRRPLLAGGHTPTSTLRSRRPRRPGNGRLRTDPLPLPALFAPPGMEDVAEDEDVGTAAGLDSGRAQKSAAGGERGCEAGVPSVYSIPKAVVVSGLEHTVAASQRALTRVLAERRVVLDGLEDDDSDASGRDPDVEDGTWNLPDGFVMVYVCKADPHERPGLLRGLLDKFSMSADIALHPSIRQSYVAYRASSSPTPRGTPLTSPLSLPHASNPFFTAPAPPQHSPKRRSAPLPPPPPQAPPVLPPSELAQLRTHARAHPPASPIFYPSVHATVPASALDPRSPPPAAHAAVHRSLDAYLLDLFAAARHHPALDGTLLTLHAHAAADALARAFRVLHGDTLGAELVVHEARMAAAAGGSTNGDGESWAEANEGAWVGAESVAGGLNRKDGGLGMEGANSPEVRVQGEDGASVPAAYDLLLPRVGFGAEKDSGAVDLGPAEELQAALARGTPEVWDVSEEDVARVFPRVVSHRLRTRDGPDDEVLGSVVWPAVPPDSGTGGATAAGSEVGGEGVRLGWERKSVKEILVRILADV